MATIYQDSKNNWLIRFRIAGIQAQRSLRTTRHSDALAAKVRVEETLRDIRLGRIEIPQSADPVQWVLGGGRVRSTRVPRSAKIGKIAELYFASIPKNAKEESTLRGERNHVKHFRRLFPQKKIRQISNSDVQQYVTDRSKEITKYGTPVSGDTIKKELKTLKLLYRFARRRKLTAQKLNFRKLHIPKRRERLRFQTRDEIESRIPFAKSEREKKLLWDCIYLRDHEVTELLTIVETAALHKWIHPAFAIAAYAGARRSEIVRIQIPDVEFARGRLFLREKKRVHSQQMTFRCVDMHPNLEKILRTWLASHPGGPHLLCDAGGEEITPDQASHHFDQTLLTTKWEILRGWHVLRHTFASLCASKGVREETISDWMGHVTEENKARYRHLFPEDTAKEMRQVFVS